MWRTRAGGPPQVYRMAPPTENVPRALYVYAGPFDPRGSNRAVSPTLSLLTQGTRVSKEKIRRSETGARPMGAKVITRSPSKPHAAFPAAPKRPEAPAPSSAAEAKTESPRAPPPYELSTAASAPSLGPASPPSPAGLLTASGSALSLERMRKVELGLSEEGDMVLEASNSLTPLPPAHLVRRTPAHRSSSSAPPPHLTLAARVCARARAAAPTSEQREFLLRLQLCPGLFKLTTRLT